MVSHSCADGGLPWGVDQLWKGHFLPGRMSFLGLKPVTAGGCPGRCPLGCCAMCLPPTPSGAVPGLLEAAYQLFGF